MSRSTVIMIPRALFRSIKTTNPEELREETFQEEEMEWACVIERKTMKCRRKERQTSEEVDRLMGTVREKALLGFSGHVQTQMH